MKKIFIFLGFVFLVFVVIKYIKYRQEFINSLDIIFKLIEEEEDTRSRTVKIYLLNKNNMFEEIEIGVIEKDVDLVNYIFQLYTSKSNSLPLGYYTPINVSTILCDLSYNEDVVNLIISDDFYRTISINSFYGLVWSYHSLGFNEINIVTTTGKIQTLRFIDYQKINLVIESSLNQAQLTTVFFPTANGMVPVTYLHDENNKTNYILDKLLSESEIDISKIQTSYLNSEGILYFNFNDPQNLLTNNIILALRRSLLFNNLYDDVIIIRNSEVFS